MFEMPWRGAGMAIPMFSVRSEADLGVGEFLDLKLLVDWAVELKGGFSSGLSLCKSYVHAQLGHYLEGLHSSTMCAAQD
ncbi:4-alpha-glucanotransferase dpe2 [Sarracenia purpurea var. burkii]